MLAAATRDLSAVCGAGQAAHRRWDGQRGDAGTQKEFARREQRAQQLGDRTSLLWVGDGVKFFVWCLAIWAGRGDTEN